MKSKIIAFVIAGTTLLGTVSASACMRYYHSSNCGKHRYHWSHGCNTCCKPSHNGQASIGDNNVTTPPTTGNDTTVTPPSSDNSTVEKPSTGGSNSEVEAPTTGEENTEITPPTTDDGTTVNPPTIEDGTTVTPPTTEEDTVTDNNASQSDKFMAQVEQAIFDRVNEERIKAGVAPLTYNTTMEKYARIKSQDMGDNNYFSHTDLNGNYITSKMQADGVSYNSWGENIAYLEGYGTNPTTLANQFMTNWMNSSGHRKNILSTNFKSMGVGVYKIGNRVYATQEFYR